ncbi:hypothetical protein C1645_819789 [Glomus cerebriforme]|uniref:Uncharacterized protein n=1 Tax=Glomus cerebriforme TaxID=658196 RepID=A0A397T8B7_9GLOM|nr:hypothetical protein C1645_819789 [Glomus cerebriforme]
MFRIWMYMEYEEVKVIVIESTESWTERIGKWMENIVTEYDDEKENSITEDNEEKESLIIKDNDEKKKKEILEGDENSTDQRSNKSEKLNSKLNINTSDFEDNKKSSQSKSENNNFDNSTEGTKSFHSIISLGNLFENTENMATYDELKRMYKTLYSLLANALNEAVVANQTILERLNVIQAITGRVKVTYFYGREKKDSEEWLIQFEVAFTASERAPGVNGEDGDDDHNFNKRLKNRFIGINLQRRKIFEIQSMKQESNKKIGVKTIGKDSALNFSSSLVSTS